MDIAVTDASQLPRRNADLPPVGGAFRQNSETFFVDEIPAYLPTGEGDHLFVLLRKQNRNTRDICARWQKVLGIAETDIGVAGLKDRNATATQWLSVYGATEQQIRDVPVDGVEILEVSRHRNKLKTGHLRGNRFTLRFSPDDEGAFARAEAICDRIRTRGLPNFYGQQRFGNDGQNREDGRLVLLGRKLAKGTQRRFLVSSYQSALFNDLLAHRIHQGLLDTALEGDVMLKHASGGSFQSESSELEQPRMDQLEISPTAPMFGYRISLASGLQGEWESAILARESLTLESFRSVGKIAIGTRRPLRIPVEGLEISQQPDWIELQFSLPSGAYASILLHELGIAFQPDK